ncbi:isoprenylcysteine carboxyl methyltransferase [Cupriavidus sp. USMAA2-4]|uniref:methyltransferase family protein n=1 Tax=Cupriavidus sp. USMAA2-4 TaxID=876364 RepID=UPI0008A6F30C|nr:isoprenylcysteine carboxylmethyltransferase family protein [Cupriavidus sp. USMAA2-4]AOY91454.1 isoprenylcysteine carboxyl methyltransferase [Cupriavidus sp. USMAA2-4]
MPERPPTDAGTVAVPRPLGLRDYAVEAALRLATSLLFAAFAYAAAQQWLADPGRITLLLIVLAEFVTIAIALTARVPEKRDWSPISVACAIAATYYFLWIQLAPGIHLVPEMVGVALQAAGILLQIGAKLTLRRAFGLLPANRGIVSGGPYRLVRHPIYLGYFISYIGFLLVNFGLQNLLVYAVQLGLLAVRAVREERLLSADPAYRAYQDKVRYRVVPGLF